LSRPGWQQAKNRKKRPDARRSRTTRAEPSQTGRASALVWPNQSYEKFVAKTRRCAECAQAGIFQAVSRTIVRTLAGFGLVATGQESFGKFSRQPQDNHGVGAISGSRLASIIAWRRCHGRISAAAITPSSRPANHGTGLVRPGRPGRRCRTRRRLARSRGGFRSTTALDEMYVTDTARRLGGVRASSLSSPLSSVSSSCGLSSIESSSSRET
jgi:hypothetical protein